MAKPYERSIFEEFDDLREYVNSMFRQALIPADTPMLPPGEGACFESFQTLGRGYALGLEKIGRVKQATAMLEENASTHVPHAR